VNEVFEREIVDCGVLEMGTWSVILDMSEEGARAGS
jgi:hypothetical protein